MKYYIHQRESGEDELILNYTHENKEVQAVLAFMDKRQKKLVGKSDGESVVFSPEDILYVEKVDEKTFVYTSEDVLQLDMALYALELLLDDVKYFRCSKSMIVNVDKVERLRSLASNRIDATLANGEHIIISRTYASDFRRLLKGENL